MEINAFFNEAETLDAVITITILVCDWMANVLYNTGSAYLYVFMRFASQFAMIFDIFDASVNASTQLESLL